MSMKGVFIENLELGIGNWELGIWNLVLGFICDLGFGTWNFLRGWRTTFYRGINLWHSGSRHN